MKQSRDLACRLALPRIRAAAAGAAALTILIAPRIAASQPPQVGSEAREQVRHARELSAAFREAAREVSPAVVNIATVTPLTPRTGALDRGSEPLDDELFRRFFGRQLPGFEFPAPGSPERTLRGQGSGVIIDRDGHIVTNNHVIEGASAITVRLHGGREYPAAVVGADPETDLAVIRIDAGELMPARLGDSDSLEVGEWVLAIGNPFGLDHTVTAGIVSAKGRRMNIIRDARGYVGYEDFIQTDAAINPGNSGGPLINLDGEVVGINTAISTRTGTYTGVGFAIPSRMVGDITASLIDDGRVQRGWLGVGIQDLTPELAAHFGYTGSSGVIVARVEPATPAQEAGLRDGDIILSMNGTPLATGADLRAAVAATPIGREIDLEIFRNGERRTVEVEIGERPSATTASAATTPNAAAAARFGLSVGPITPQLAREFELPTDQGVIVTAVTPDGPAAGSGIRPGDIITRIGDADIRSIDDYRTATREVDAEKGLLLQVRRGEATIFIVVRAG
jgi:serine protease Do